MIAPHTHQRTTNVNYRGVKVKITVLAYCEITDEIVMSCFDDYVRSLGRKKPKARTELTFPTQFGLSNRL